MTVPISSFRCLGNSIRTATTSGNPPKGPGENRRPSPKPTAPLLPSYADDGLCEQHTSHNENHLTSISKLPHQHVDERVSQPVTQLSAFLFSTHSIIEIFSTLSACFETLITLCAVIAAYRGRPSYFAVLCAVIAAYRGWPSYFAVRSGLAADRPP